MASNRPDDLDWAVTSRTDEMVGFDLPGKHSAELAICQET